jgi:hypothetical protein
MFKEEKLNLICKNLCQSGQISNMFTILHLHTLYYIAQQQYVSKETLKIYKSAHASSFI